MEGEWHHGRDGRKGEGECRFSTGGVERNSLRGEVQEIVPDERYIHYVGNPPAS